MTTLRLRPLRAADEPAFVAGHEVLTGEGSTFALGYERTSVRRR